MKEVDSKILEIISYAKKLSAPKQEEILDYVKWIWLNIGKNNGKDIKKAILKIRDIQMKHKAPKNWDSVEVLRKWRESR
ncbi:hypothetical protein A3J90_01815 [candidate division WOR-1 bacterium RIFOXYC2_FULL_37_10]|uniref:DUF2281 domain-containing protein n=1 Tax=candidate division WOR-1 bacterium RIFOXYB2_FULL_37_13 TaxID=1802579 RepID=A0A1F4SR47_UNCSA|nr:MAG: hypothetical protein A2310_04820 [candidate division WOR-1 bacterium RIFOXYB2_FULL_37_13]OGC35066.1 MAG: hypothetical protein A3J90_01815 [candidate division WOR-1 bacterium RIFOXYC2_FULL_37_10]